MNIALTSILDSSQPSTEKAKLIQRAETEQAAVIKGITAAIRNISEQIEHISKATKEQNLGSRQILETMGNVSRQADQIAGAISRQREKSKEIVKAIESIKKIANESVGIFNTMNLAIKSLEEEAKTNFRGLRSNFSPNPDFNERHLVLLVLKPAPNKENLTTTGICFISNHHFIFPTLSRTLVVGSPYIYGRP